MIEINKKRIILSTCAGVVLLLVLGGVIMYFVQRSHWTTFEKKKYGYSFSYPKDWVAVNNQNSNTETRFQAFQIDGKQLFHVFLLFPKPDICADLKTCAQKNQRTYQDADGNPKGQPFEDIGLLREERHGPNAVLSQYFRWHEGKSTTYFLFRDGVLATFTNYGVPERIVNKIIASFRIDSQRAIAAATTVNLASWTTYTNTAYGLQFQFPSYWGVIDYPHILDPAAFDMQIGISTSAGHEGYVSFHAYQEGCVALKDCVEAERQKIRDAGNSYAPYLKMYQLYSDQIGPVDGFISQVRFQGYTQWYYYYLNHDRLIELTFRDFDNDVSNSKMREAIIASLKFN